MPMAAESNVRNLLTSHTQILCCDAKNCIMIFKTLMQFAESLEEPHQMIKTGFYRQLQICFHIKIVPNHILLANFRKIF